MRAGSSPVTDASRLMGFTYSSGYQYFAYHAGMDEWMMSPAYSRMIASDGSDPVRADVPARPGMPPLSEQKIISLTVDEIRKGVPEVIEQWRDTFGS